MIFGAIAATILSLLVLWCVGVQIYGLVFPIPTTAKQKKWLNTAVSLLVSERDWGTIVVCVIHVGFTAMLAKTHGDNYWFGVLTIPWLLDVIVQSYAQTQSGGKRIVEMFRRSKFYPRAMMLEDIIPLEAKPYFVITPGYVRRYMNRYEPEQFPF